MMESLPNINAVMTKREQYNEIIAYLSDVVQMPTKQQHELINAYTPDLAEFLPEQQLELI